MSMQPLSGTQIARQWNSDIIHSVQLTTSSHSSSSLTDVRPHHCNIWRRRLTNHASRSCHTDRQTDRTKSLNRTDAQSWQHDARSSWQHHVATTTGGQLRLCRDDIGVAMQRPYHNKQSTPRRHVRDRDRRRSGCCLRRSYRTDVNYPCSVPGCPCIERSQLPRLPRDAPTNLTCRVRSNFPRQVADFRLG